MGSIIGAMNYFHFLTLVTRPRTDVLSLGSLCLHRIKRKSKKIFKITNISTTSIHFTVHLSLSNLESILNLCILLQILSNSCLLLYGSHILIFLSLFSEYISITFHWRRSRRQFLIASVETASPVKKFFVLSKNTFFSFILYPVHNTVCRGSLGSHCKGNSVPITVLPFSIFSRNHGDPSSSVEASWP